MSMTVVGLYRTEEDVRRVMDDLARNDFPRSGITRHDDANAGLERWLEAQGVPEREAEEYVEGVRNGGHLIALEASDARSDDAVAIMRRHEHDMDAGAAGTMGATGMGATGAAARTTTDDARMRGDVEGEERVEVVEEELEVGKRQVERGGVNVRTYVSERPVEEDVQLRDETVHVERHAVDRPASAADADAAFREREISMTETDEEAVTSKRARVIEEIVLSKDVETRTETVRDTVRRTDVDIEGAEGARTDAGERYVFDDDRDHFRTHHRDTFANSQYGYEEFEPAYRYGTDLWNHPDYGGSDWNAISGTARDRWERQNAGTWTEFEPAVRYGYERAQGYGRR